jgi:hypothetical protein
MESYIPKEDYSIFTGGDQVSYKHAQKYADEPDVFILNSSKECIQTCKLLLKTLILNQWYGT